MRQPLENARYDSIADFLSAMKAQPNKEKNIGLWRGWGFIDSNPSFYGAGCKTGADVQKKMSDGWQEGRDRLSELSDKLNTVEMVPQDRRRKMVRADSGDSLDIHQIYAGRADIAWTTPRRQTSRAPQKIELFANMICTGGDHADVLFWRGAAAVVLATMLESAGYMVRLVVGFGGQTMESEKVSCRITVKEHGNPFDVTSTSAVIMPGFFRALGHAWITGHCQKKMSESGITVQSGIVDDGEIELSHKIRDHGTALAFINDTIEAINNGTMNAAA